MSKPLVRLENRIALGVHRRKVLAPHRRGGCINGQHLLACEADGVAGLADDRFVPDRSQ